MLSYRRTSNRSEANEKLAPAIGIANGIALSLSLWAVLGSAWMLAR